MNPPEADLQRPDLPEPDELVDVGGGRFVGVDDRGDPAGQPLLYFHGTPDTRVARHPDDQIAHRLGVRLIAVDRPGLGGSTADPDATPLSVADDHIAVLDHLGVETAALLAWSGGSISALAVAGRHPGRVHRLTLVAPLVPRDAYDDPSVLEGSDESRRLFVESLAHTTPAEAGREMAMWLVPPEIDEATARMLLADGIDAISHVAGAGDALVAALVGSVASGMTGVEREIASQATPLGDLLDRVSAPATVHVGTHDRLTPPAMAHWLGRRISAPVIVHEGQGHLLAIERWADLVGEAAAR